jgi:hypothetical protein
VSKLVVLKSAKFNRLNYAVVAVGIVITYATVLWLVAARKFFEGPHRHLEAAALGVDISDPLKAQELEAKENEALAPQELEAKRLEAKNV